MELFVSGHTAPALLGLGMTLLGLQVLKYQLRRYLRR